MKERREENIYKIIAHSEPGSRFTLKYHFGIADVSVEISRRGQKKTLKVDGSRYRDRIISGPGTVRDVLGHPYAMIVNDQLIYNAVPLF